MKLPNSNKVLIPKEKLLNYILSETHATGKFKAKFFRGLGFNEQNINFFKKALVNLTKTSEIKEETKSPYGTKYTIEGEINTPNRNRIKVRTIWIVDKDSNKPRFITIYPL